LETIDDETTAAAIDFMDRQQKSGKPWFCYFNATLMHVNTHLKKRLMARRAKAFIPTAWSNMTDTLASS
jgi:arylsulfatase A-like enzyme